MNTERPALLEVLSPQCFVNKPEPPDSAGGAS